MRLRLPKFISKPFGRAADWVLVPIMRRRMRRMGRSMLENSLKARLKFAGLMIAATAVFTVACRWAGFDVAVTDAYLIVALPTMATIRAITMSAGVAKMRSPSPEPKPKDSLGKRVGLAVFRRLPKSVRVAMIKKVVKTAVKTAVTDPLILGFVAGYIFLLVGWRVAIYYAAK